MPEMDLIPSDYRQQLRLRRWLRRFGLLYAVLLVAIHGDGGLGREDGVIVVVANVDDRVGAGEVGLQQMRTKAAVQYRSYAASEQRPPAGQMPLSLQSQGNAERVHAQRLADHGVGEISPVVFDPQILLDVRPAQSPQQCHGRKPIDLKGVCCLEVEDVVVEAAERPGG